MYVLVPGLTEDVHSLSATWNQYRTLYEAPAWGRGSNIEFGVAGTKQLVLSYLNMRNSLSAYCVHKQPYQLYLDEH